MYRQNSSSKDPRGSWAGYRQYFLLQCFLNFNVHSTHQGFLLKCKLWLSKFEMGLKFCICNKFPGGPQALSSKELQYHSWEFNVMGTDPSVKEHHACSGYLLLCIKPAAKQSGLQHNVLFCELIGLSSVELTGHLSSSCHQKLVRAVWFSVLNVQEGSLMWLAADTRCCRGAQVGLLTVMPPCGLSMWLGLLIALWLF